MYNSPDVVEDFADVSVEGNSSPMGLMVPPDLVLSTLLTRSETSIQRRGVAGPKGYRIVAMEAPPMWQPAREKTRSDSLLTTACGSATYFKPADGVTISVPGGGDALRKTVLLKNALRNNNARTTYTRPVFDIQHQRNLHFETPRVTLLGSPYQQLQEYHYQHYRQLLWAPTTCASVTGVIWNLPSIKLLYQELTLNRGTKREVKTWGNLISTEFLDINRAIGDIEACSVAFEKNNNNTTTSESNLFKNNREMAVTSAVNSIISSSPKKDNNQEKRSGGGVYDAIDELALAPALLRRSGTGHFIPPASMACGMFASPVTGAATVIARKNYEKKTWWTTDANLIENAAAAAEQFIVLTPSLLDIHPPDQPLTSLV